MFFAFLCHCARTFVCVLSVDWIIVVVAFLCRFVRRVWWKRGCGPCEPSLSARFPRQHFRGVLNFRVHNLARKSKGNVCAFESVRGRLIQGYRDVGGLRRLGIRTAGRYRCPQARVDRPTTAVVLQCFLGADNFVSTFLVRGTSETTSWHSSSGDENRGTKKWTCKRVFGVERLSLSKLFWGSAEPKTARERLFGIRRYSRWLQGV